jgi:hypothetical protein
LGEGYGRTHEECESDRPTHGTEYISLMKVFRFRWGPSG